MTINFVDTCARICILAKHMEAFKGLVALSYSTVLLCVVGVYSIVACWWLERVRALRACFRFHAVAGRWRSVLSGDQAMVL
jgi:hypothetical protein